MISASKLRNGTLFEYQDEPFRVINFKHTHMGRGSADVRVKIRGLVSGLVLSKNFSPDERFNEASLLKKNLQYLYSDNEKIYLMDEANYSQQSIDKALIGEQLGFLKEGTIVKVLFWEEQAIGIELPITMEFEVIEAEPGAKGNSAVNIFKSVSIDTGHQVKVPIFINTGDKIKVNTESGEYLGRA